ncbi:hypothetical protein [Arthrobacter polaris]|uniref:hypothetical protein n=1 Tax=Arthrobacter polaris TaxID=2813727 RepID=UPI001F2186CE|nr:hypothetical protein [Arthrobacter polaris]UIK89891.1 hypothetical protein J0916_06025 [Arthrobacter polaris]
MNIDLTSSRHVEATALASLQDGRILAAVRARTMVQGSFINNFTVTAPLILPVCPALFPVEFTKSVHLTMRA